MLGVQHGSGGGFGGDGIMNARRFATVAASCGTVVLAGWVVASVAGFGSGGIEITAAVPIEDRRAPSLAADGAGPRHAGGFWHNLAETHPSTSKPLFDQSHALSAVPNCAIA